MISVWQAMRSAGWGLTLLPLFLSLFIIARIELRRAQRNADRMRDGARQLRGYRMGSYLCLLMAFVSLLWWVGPLVESGFNWTPADVGEIDVLEFPSPDPQTTVQRIVRVTEKSDVSRLFDDLKCLVPYSGQHEHAVGKSYVLRLRRRSDGQWSAYRVRIYPASESTDGLLHTRGVYFVSLEVGGGKANVGSYRAPELGRFVEELVAQAGRY